MVSCIPVCRRGGRGGGSSCGVCVMLEGVPVVIVVVGYSCSCGGSSVCVERIVVT